VPGGPRSLLLRPSPLWVAPSGKNALASMSRRGQRRNGVGHETIGRHPHRSFGVRGTARYVGCRGSRSSGHYVPRAARRECRVRLPGRDLESWAGTRLGGGPSNHRRTDRRRLLRRVTAQRTGRRLAPNLAMSEGRLTLSDGRTLAWREYGPPDGRPLLRFQGMPGSRNSRHPHEESYDRFGVRVIVADRPGFGVSTRLEGRGISVVAADAVALLDHLGLDVVYVSGTSGGGPHALASGQPSGQPQWS